MVARPPALLRRQGPEGLGVEHDRRGGTVVAGRQQEPDELCRGEARPEAGPDDDRIVVVVEDPGERRLRVDLLDVVLRQRHRRRLDDLGGEQRLKRFRDRQRDEPRAGPARRAADEERRAGVVQGAGNHEQLPERSLVSPLVAGRQ